MGFGFRASFQLMFPFFLNVWFSYNVPTLYGSLHSPNFFPKGQALKKYNHPLVPIGTEKLPVFRTKRTAMRKVLK
ncbi:hypothetical protein CMO93_01360 [Candidatus Woesearchaeota archaeon]|nr:hypothetical protein [Candidatus Woesearchaeota archaeon]|tara:strand:+ start:70 stop:294 length:225 start_codon:yes stop_codon:yes gene_type:complete